MHAAPPNSRAAASHEFAEQLGRLAVAFVDRTAEEEKGPVPVSATLLFPHWLEARFATPQDPGQIDEKRL